MVNKPKLAKPKITKPKIAKPKIAIVGLTSDEGCQFVLLDLGKKLFNLFKKVELINFSLIGSEDNPYPSEKIDVVFVEGVPITQADINTLKYAREKAKILVALGNCAALGGIPEMKNYQNKEKTIRFIYKNLKKVANPEIKEIDNFVKVDFVIPGCPINGEEFLKFADDLIYGKIPEICQSPVCVECHLRGTQDCFLAKKEICLGPATLAGCEAICTKNEFHCLGCRGLLNKENARHFLNILEKFGSKKDVEESLEIFGIKDDILESSK